MDLSTITVLAFKAHFSRDFQYGTTPEQVMDSDITRAFSEARVNLNQSLFISDEEITLAYLYLTAHYLVHDLKTAASGAAGGADNPVSSRTVGNVSESYAIPLAFVDNPLFSFLAKTGYGQKFLSFVIPRLVGNIGSVEGATRP